jgi:hypothetical protein
MDAGDADDLVPFADVRVIRSTAPALLCRIGSRNVWLPRGHVSGKLWCAGDRGRLYVRRWVARDRQLPLPATPIRLMSPASDTRHEALSVTDGKGSEGT